jgi:hypothetical protein
MPKGNKENHNEVERAKELLSHLSIALDKEQWETVSMIIDPKYWDLFDWVDAKR